MMILAGDAANGVEVLRLTPENYLKYKPRGKEVDAIIGDYVMMNDRIVVVVADPIPSRNANMTVRGVGGQIIDMTRRRGQNDQLSCYYIDANRRPLRSIKVDASTEAGVVLTLQSREITAKRGLGLTVKYQLKDGWDYVLVTTEHRNYEDKDATVVFSDSIRADRTFTRGGSEDKKLAWVYDHWWTQAYGVVAADKKDSAQMLKGRSHVVSFTINGENRVKVAKGKTVRFSRRLYVAGHTLALRGMANRLTGKKTARVNLEVSDKDGAIAGADIEFKLKGKPYGEARTDKRGRVSFVAPKGSYELEVNAIGRSTIKSTFDLERNTQSIITMDQAGYVKGVITDGHGKGMPVKVQFIGREGTKSPFFFVDSGEFAVHNLVYTANGKFTQAIGPGEYDVIISRGNEYDAAYRTIKVKRGEVTEIKAKLNRVLKTPGWVTADFHSHSSPSGDNTGSQLGRVLNLLAEHVEFAPCTEHNRVDTYVPHLKYLKATKFMGTTTGIELTGRPLPLNHQNAFPLIHRPGYQDGGGPVTDGDVIKQIKRLAEWDDKSEKLVQQNHPNIIQLLFDGNLDGKRDKAFTGAIPYMHVTEIHQLHGILTRVNERNGVNTGRNRPFSWMQAINNGIYVPGVVNTDAHYNFHGSCWLRNYIKSPTDDPGKIKPLDIVREARKGHVVMTNGPFLDVGVVPVSRQRTAEPAIAGDTVSGSKGSVIVRIKVQCANYLDIDRVQILVNGVPDKRYNFTRKTHPKMFSDKVMKFNHEVVVNVTKDAHLIVVATSESTVIGPVMGPKWGKVRPIAVTNPIFIDQDGDGFKPDPKALPGAFPK